MEVCNDHNWIEITRYLVDYQTEEVISWCKTCGTLFICLEHDNRQFNGKFYTPLTQRSE
jgi:hypothetical protein